MDLFLLEGSRVALTARQHEPEEREYRAELDVVGEVALQANARGELTVTSLELVIGEIELSPEELPPVGIHLRDVRVSIDAPVDGTGLWSFDGEQGAGELLLELDLDWTLVAPNGQELPLATQHIDGTGARVDVWNEDGRIAAALRFERPDTFFEWAGLFELSDLEIELLAAE